MRIVIFDTDWKIIQWFQNIPLVYQLLIGSALFILISYFVLLFYQMFRSGGKTPC